MNELIGTSEREVSYCGHRIWDAYTNKAGRDIGAGGSVTVRHDWVDNDKRAQHSIKELRIDPDHGDLNGIRRELEGLSCGERIVTEIATIESPRGTQWRNLVAVHAVETAGV